MKKIIAFSGSNSSQSINHDLITYVSSQLEGVKVIRLTDFDIPMYGIDLEKSAGIPAGVRNLMALLTEADAVIISTPEHNGLMPAFFKSILDWLSRTGVKYLAEKPTLVLSTSPGNGAGKNAAFFVEKILGYAGANVIGRFNMPRFGDNFDSTTKEIVNKEWDDLLKAELAHLNK